MKIAIVGIGCHYPGAHSGTELFENIMSGRRYFRQVPPERWNSKDYYHPDKKNPDTTYCKKAAVIDGFDFDPNTYKIPRSTYLATDQAHWLALKVTQDALIDANLKELPNERTAAIIGNTLTGEVSRASLVRYRWPYAKKVFAELFDNFKIGNDLKQQLLEKVEVRYKAPFPPINEDNLAGGLSNTIAGRIANYFDLKGGAFTTDGACSSSLLAINQSCVSLERGDIDVAITGGVDISLDPFEIVGFAKVGALSNNDIQVYDQNSSGFLPGEGCGIIILKRYEDAVEVNDKIYAVINGVGISSDGKGGITAPSIGGQSLAVDRAYACADYSFADVELIEGHGTGTIVGDNVELNTFRNLKLKHGANGSHQCGVGSIKSNIGHTKAAAGVAGFLKATLSVYYGFLPPTKGIKTPNSIFKETENLFPLVTPKFWSFNKVRRAAVSSAGFGGINTHLTLSSDDKCDHPEKKQSEIFGQLMHSFQNSEVLFIGAEDISDLKQKISLLLTAANKIAHAQLIDLAQYCVNNFSAKNLRLAIVSSSPEQLETQLNLIQNYLGSVTGISQIDYVNAKEGIFTRTTGQRPRITFLFPGQGSQFLNMGKLFKSRDESIGEFWDYADQILDNKIEHSLSDYVFLETDLINKKTRRNLVQKLNDTSIAQPAITACSIAMAKYLKKIGITPDFSIGHSLGEYSALWSAGIIDDRSTLELVTARGDAMAKSADVPGAMLSIGASASQVEELIKEVIGYVTVSNLNSPKQTVVSGEQFAIDAAFELCSHYGFSVVRLPVSSAFHSKLMENAAPIMRQHLNSYEFKAPEHFVISTVTGKLVSAEQDVKEILIDQLLQPVKFIDAIKEAEKENCHCYIEVGPGKVLSRLTENILDKSDNYIFSTDIGLSGNQSESYNSMLAYTYACGFPVNTNEIYKNRFYRQIELPYQPSFISSPCENSVDALDLNLGSEVNLEELSKLNESTMLDSKLLDSNTDLGTTPEVFNTSENSPDSVYIMLRDFIVKEYGYSEEIINHDSKLQENLALDSLKSMEVLFEAMGNLGIRADASNLGDISLIEIANYLYDMSSGNSDNTDIYINHEFKTPQADWVRAFTIDMSPNKLTGAKRTYSEGKVLIFSQTKLGLIDQISNALKKIGLLARVVSANETPILEEPVVGCIVIGSAKDEVDLFEEKNIKERLYEQPKLLLNAAKTLISNHPKPNNRFFVYVTEKGGVFSSNGYSPVNIDQMAGSGFVKTIHLEFPKIQTRVIDFNPSMSDYLKAALVVDEITHGEGHVDSGYLSEDIRAVPEFKLCQTSKFKKQKNPLKSGDTILVTGGGKGITAECILELALSEKINVAIVGSSPGPDRTKDNDNFGKNNELSLNLSRFEKSGINHKYYQCDVLDEAGVSKLFNQVESDLGAIKGIIHAAGINILHRLDDLEWSDFLQILQPKMEGLYNIIKAANLPEIKLFTVFSSIIGHTGMMGNSDYSYANEWMSLVLNRLQKMHTGLNCQAFSFSVWSDVGMGANLGSIDVLNSIGVSAIPLETGINKFVDMSSRQWPNTDMVVCSRVGGLKTIDFSKKQLPKNRFLDSIQFLQPGVELISEVFLTPEVDNYLTDHDFEGSLLFPAVMGIEAMVECSMACINANNIIEVGLPTLQNLSFDRAIIVPEEGRSIRIYVQVEEPELNGAQIANVVIRSSVTNYEVDYFSAQCLWENTDAAMPESDLQLNGALSLDPMKELYGKILFQGPMFQNIESFHELSDKHCTVKIKTDNTASVFSEVSGFSGIFGSAEIRDAFLHAVQLCVPEYKILPISIEKVIYKTHNSSYLILKAIERARVDNEFTYDLSIHNDMGDCVELMPGFRCRIMGDYKNKENLTKILAAHTESTNRYSLEKVV